MTALTQTIPAYSYTQYFDDDNIQAFFAAFNLLAQQYLNTINALQLPVYPNKTGAFLDWVGNGVYGYARPVVSLGVATVEGPINSIVINGYLPVNGFVISGNDAFYTATDDLYIRCLCWHHFKADGSAFTVPWLKRRIARFLYGPGAPSTVNGFTGWTFDVGLLSNISVAFPSAGNVTVTIPAAASLSAAFRALVRSGALQTPFQFTFTVNLV